MPDYSMAPLHVDTEGVALSRLAFDHRTHRDGLLSYRQSDASVVLVIFNNMSINY